MRLLDDEYDHVLTRPRRSPPRPREEPEEPRERRDKRQPQLIVVSDPWEEA